MWQYQEPLSADNGWPIPETANEPQACWTDSGIEMAKELQVSHIYHNPTAKLPGINGVHHRR
jgi:hypothetical protein